MNSRKWISSPSYEFHMHHTKCLHVMRYPRMVEWMDSLPCVEHGRVSRDISIREHNFGTSSRQISAISVAFLVTSSNVSAQQIYTHIFIYNSPTIQWIMHCNCIASRKIVVRCMSPLSVASLTRQWKKKKHTYFSMHEYMNINVRYLACWPIAICRSRSATVAHTRMAPRMPPDRWPNDTWEMWSIRFRGDALESDNGTRCSVALCASGYLIRPICFRMRLSWTRICSVAA